MFMWLFGPLDMSYSGYCGQYLEGAGDLTRSDLSWGEVP